MSELAKPLRILPEFVCEDSQGRRFESGLDETPAQGVDDAQLCFVEAATTSMG